MTGEVALNDWDDSALVEAARWGETTAFEELVRRYQTLAFRTAWLITGNAADAEEASQEGFVNAWRMLDRFDHRRGVLAIAGRRTKSETFRPWLLTIVANQARIHRRSRQRRPALELDAIPGEMLIDPERLPDRLVEQREAQAELLRAMAELPERDRLVLELRYFLELSESEMAGVLGVAKGTVKSRLSRAIARLRTVLEAEPGRTEDDLSTKQRQPG